MLITWLAVYIVTGSAKFEDIPSVLKPKVYAELKKQGCEFVAGDYRPEGEI